jgi:uncharacterized protein YndB with AHSA1/START domain
MRASVETPDNEPIIVMTRVFDASVELVWKAHTDPKQLAQWWGPRGFEVIECRLAAAPGEPWRIAQKSPDGQIFTFKGECLEMTPGRRIVQTFGMEGMFEDKVIVETLEMEDIGDGRTKITTVQRFESFEDRAGMLSTGMETGANDSWDRLDELLERAA